MTKIYKKCKENKLVIWTCSGWNFGKFFDNVFHNTEFLWVYDVHDIHLTFCSSKATYFILNKNNVAFFNDQIKSWYRNQNIQGNYLVTHFLCQTQSTFHLIDTFYSLKLPGIISWCFGHITDCLYYLHNVFPTNLTLT